MNVPMLSRIPLCLLLAASACMAGGTLPVAEVTSAISRAESVANDKGYAAFLDEMFVAGPDIMVQSEEFFPVFYGRDRVSAYFNPPTGNLYAHRERYSNVEGTLLRPGLALVTWHNRYDMQAVGRLPVGGWSRMVGVMRQTPDGWKFVSLVQAPMSLISQARRMQEEAISPDFVEFARRQNPSYDALVAADKRIAARRTGLPWLTGGGNTQDAAEGGPASATPAAAKASAAAAAAGKAAEQMDLARQVEATLRRGEVLYDRNDSVAFFDELWSGEQNLVFMSEQFFPVFYGRRPVEAYFKPPMKNLYSYRERYSNIEAMALEPDLAAVTYHVRYDMHAITRTPLGGWSRIFAVMKKEGGRWLFVAQFEAPMSMISQARWTHEAALAPDFLEFSRRQNPEYDAQVARDKKIQARKGAGVPWVSAGENVQQGAPRPSPTGP